MIKTGHTLALIDLNVIIHYCYGIKMKKNKVRKLDK